MLNHLRLNVILFLLILVLLWIPLAFSQPPNIYTFSGDVDLGVHYTAFASSGQHYIGAKGDTVYVVTSNGRVWCQKSTDGGQTFGLPVLVDWGYNPSMRVDTAGVVYVAYQDVYADIRFSKSTDGGMTFTLGVKVNDDTMPEIGQEKPTIAVNNRGQIFIAWRDQRTAPGQPHKAIFAAASYDGGLTFTPNIQINDSLTPIGVGIDIGASDGGDVFAVWGSYYGTLFVSRSDDSGSSFYSRSPVCPLAYNLSLAVIDTIVGVAWDIFGNAAIRFSISGDGGRTFSTSTIADSSSPAEAPSLVWANGLFFVAYEASHTRADGKAYRDVFFVYTSDSGASFVPHKLVNSDSFRSHCCAAVALNRRGEAFVAWLDARNDPFYGEDYHTFVARGEPNFIKGDLNLDFF